MRLSSLHLAALAAALLAGASCTKDNNNYCEGDCPDAGPDAEIDAPPVQGCVDNPTICTGDDMTCVGDVCKDCDVATDDNVESDACTTSAQPVCGTGNDCRACTSDAECGHGLCWQGTCPADVLYVSSTGSDGGANDCTDAAAPCASVQRALMQVPETAGAPETNRRYIKLVDGGSYEQGGQIVVDNRTVVIVGPPTGTLATLDRSGNGALLVVRNDANLTLERVALDNSVNDLNAHGLDCMNATVTANKVEVRNNNGIGIKAATCTLAITNSEISRNLAGGLDLSVGSLVLVNNLILNNGTSDSTFGGVRISSSVAATSVIQSNTIFKNEAMSITDASGIECRATGVTARNNIIWSDLGGVAMTGICGHTNALYGPTANAVGALDPSNMVVADMNLFQFAATASRNFHIGATSIAKDKGTITGQAPAASHDIDGELRPQGLPDVGYDEIP